MRGKRCLVVGGGAVDARKVTNLLAAGADVKVVSPLLTESLAVQADRGRFTWIEGSYSAKQLEGAFLVVAATDDEKLNAEIVSTAADLGVLACDASSAERSQVIFGALHKSEGNLTVAVFTDGRDPSHARRTRDRIATQMTHDLEAEGRSGST